MADRIFMALVIGGALIAAAWIISLGNRYELGSLGGVPIRINRASGEVVFCDPAACRVLIPPGARPDPWKPASK